MAQFSLIVKIRDPKPELLQAMVDSLLGQTWVDWQLLCLVDPTRPLDRELVADLTAGDERIQMELRPDAELAAWGCNALLPQLGTWIGFLGQYDQLDPAALAQINTAWLNQPAAQVVFTDEESHSHWGQVSLRSSKGIFDPIRLRSQEYLRNLTLIHTNLLQTLGGFDRLASDFPAHDLFLRAYEQQGIEAFCYVPQRLFWRYRDYWATRSTDPRKALHMVNYDLYAVRQHLERTGLPGTVHQVNGTCNIQYRFPNQPSVAALVLVDDDIEAGTVRLQQLQVWPVYAPCVVTVIDRGNSPETEATYRQLCSGLRYQYRRMSGSRPEVFNQAAATVDATLVLFLEGQPISPDWLRRLADHSKLPGVGAIGARLVTPVHLTQPGTVGYRYEGWDWNSRGQFNRLSVPHAMGVLSPRCLLLDLRRFFAMGGFDTSFPTLFGQDLCLRLNQAGLINLQVPESTVCTAADASIDEAEQVQLALRWAGWNDPYGLHQSF